VVQMKVITARPQGRSARQPCNQVYMFVETGTHSLALTGRPSAIRCEDCL
jgi:hypothetical protein